MKNNFKNNKPLINYFTFYDKKYHNINSLEEKRQIIIERIDLLYKKIEDNKHSKKLNEKKIGECTKQYNKIKGELLSLKDEMITCTSIYSDKKINSTQQNKDEKINDNNIYFRQICKINKKIDKTIIKLNKLTSDAKKLSVILQRIKLQIKKDKQFLNELEYYLDFLNARIDYVTQYKQKSIVKKNIKKANKK